MLDDLAEQRLRPLGSSIGVGADDLGQAAELLERVTLGDPLRAEDDVDPVAPGGELLRDVLGRPRVDRAPEHDERAILEVRRDLVDGSFEDGHRRPEELVDGRPDDHDDRRGPADHRRVRAEHEPARRQ